LPAHFTQHDTLIFKDFGIPMTCSPPSTLNTLSQHPHGTFFLMHPQPLSSQKEHPYFDGSDSLVCIAGLKSLILMHCVDIFF
jgi:hypothetical protein